MVPGLSVTEWRYRHVLVIVFGRFLSCFEMVCLKISAACFYVRGFLFCQADGRCLSGAPVEVVLPVFRMCLIVVPAVIYLSLVFLELIKK